MLGSSFLLHAIQERMHSIFIWIAMKMFPVLLGFELKSATAKIIVRLGGGRSILLLKKYVTLFTNFQVFIILGILPEYHVHYLGIRETSFK